MLSLPPAVDIANRKVTITAEVVFISHPKTPKWKKKKRKRTAASSYFQVGEKQKPEEQGHEQAHRLPPRGWDARGTSRLGTQNRGQSSPLSRAGRLGPCIIRRNTYQETGKHTKPYYWETCRQIINLLGTIEAFRYFWLQMLVTHTCIQTSFFSPLEWLCPLLPPSPQHLSFTKQTPLALRANSRERWGQSRWQGEEISYWSSKRTPQNNFTHG